MSDVFDSLSFNRTKNVVISPGLSRGSLSGYSADPSLFLRRIAKIFPSPLTLPPSTNTAHRPNARRPLDEVDGFGRSTCTAAAASWRPKRICSRLPEVMKRLSWDASH